MDSNFGSRNKGLGELAMLDRALEEFPEIVEKCSTLSYMTGRRVVTCPYVFERTQALTAQILAGNPDFVYTDGKVIFSHKDRMLNDMFFSMEAPLMAEYSNFSRDRRDYLEGNLISSERNLFEFVAARKLEVEWLPWLGFIRPEIGRSRLRPRRIDWHFC